MADRVSHPKYEFGDFELDVRQRRLSRRVNSEPLAITARVFDALLYLVEHRDRLVEKSELLAALWPNVVVEEGNLSTTIYTLRRLLGERPDEHRYIVTVSGRGYRFVADVMAPGDSQAAEAATPAETASSSASAAPAAPAARAGRRRSAVIATLAVVALLVAVAGYFLMHRPTDATAPRANTLTAPAAPANDHKLTPLTVIAVLPFDNQTGDPAFDRAGDNFVQSLNRVLNEAPQLSVVAKRSADVSAASGGDVRAIARALGATHLLEIGASGSGDALKLSARLIDGGVGYQVWSKEFRPTRAAFLKGSDDIMLAVAAVVDLRAGAVAFEDGDPGTRNVEAYIELLRGIKSRTRVTEPELVAAVAHFEAATRLDPDFSRAWLLLAAAHAYTLYFGFDRTDTVARFHEAANYARESRPDSKVAHVAYATVAMIRGEWDEAEKHFLAGAAGGRVSMAVYLQTGRLRDAERIERRIHADAPGDPAIALNLALVRGIAGDTREAQSFADDAVRGGIPEEILLIQVFRANSAEAAGHYSEAADHMMKVLAPALRAQGGDEAAHLFYEALEKPASRPRALAALARLELALDHKRYSTYFLRMLLINWHVRLGAMDEAFRLADDWLAQYRENSLVGMPHLSPLWAPHMRDFRRDPRFARFAAGLKMMDYWKKHGPPDDCRLDGDKLDCS